MIRFLQQFHSIVWGVPTLLLILGTGIWLTLRTGFAQIRLFPQAIREFLSRFTGKMKNVSSYQALCTALAATVGIGNLAGVAGAIALGGPGSVFWIWVSGFLGMTVKMAEATLAVHYQRRNAAGELVGGPMYIIQHGMGQKWSFLAVIYCFFGIVATFGVGNATQINAVLGALSETLKTKGISLNVTHRTAIGVLLALGIGFLLAGGAGRIGQAAERLVPFAAGGYILLCSVVLVLRADALPQAFSDIFQGAFHPQAITGGAVGSALVTVRTGISRGVFTNEAGMGTASIAHAGADVPTPLHQGRMGMMEVFIDTLVICTLTALVILCSGIPIPYGVDCGAELTMRAFASVLGDWVCGWITLALCLFAVATVLGWGLYGARCAQYLFGENIWRRFTALQMLAVVVGAVLNTGVVWLFSEITNGLMAIPNIIALLALSPVLCAVMEKCFGGDAANGGTNENIDQRKSLRTVSHAEISPSGSGGGEKWKEDLPPEYRAARFADTP